MRMLLWHLAHHKSVGSRRQRPGGGQRRKGKEFKNVCASHDGLFVSSCPGRG